MQHLALIFAGVALSASSVLHFPASAKAHVLLHVQYCHITYAHTHFSSRFTLPHACLLLCVCICAPAAIIDAFAWPVGVAKSQIIHARQSRRRPLRICCMRLQLHSCCWYHWIYFLYYLVAWICCDFPAGNSVADGSVFKQYA